MTKKKIVISGASSSIINAVIDLIQTKDKYNIVGITRKLQQEHRKDIDWVECDLSKDNNEYSFLKSVDTIIHAAAVSKAYSLQEYFKTNFESTKKLVDMTNRFQVNRFVYISSILADVTSGYYGLSKITSEKYIKSNSKNWLIIRPSQLYGYSEKTPIDSIIKKVSNNKMIFSPIGDPYRLVPIHYLEAAHLIFESIFIKDFTNTTKLVTGPQVFNYKSLVTEIMKSLNRKVLVIPIPKIIMMSIKYLLQTFNIKTGIYPDQITRLYNPNRDIKNSGNSKIMHLSEYIKMHLFGN